MFQTIHSVFQLSIHGAVANWCQQFGVTEEEKGRVNWSVDKSILTSVPPDEVQLLVSPPTKASGNSLQETVLSFEALSSITQFSKLCEDAHFKHRVSGGMKYKTRLGEDDGTFSRARPQSRVFAAIPGGTVIGPVLEVRVVKILGEHGLRISIASALKHEGTSHVVISRGTQLFCG